MRIRFLLLTFVCCQVLFLQQIQIMAQTCSKGFMDSNLLAKKAEQISNTGGSLSTIAELEKDTKWILTPSGCSNGIMTQLMMGVDIRSVSEIRNQYPSIETWSRHGNTLTLISTNRIHLTPDNITDDGVYRYTFPTPISLGKHYRVGIYQPASERSVVRVYAISTGSSNVDRVRDSAVNDLTLRLSGNSATKDVNSSPYRLLILPVTEPSNCFSGFASMNDLTSNSPYITGVMGVTDARAFPDISITCDGIITNMIVGTSSTVQSNNFPLVQLRRSSVLYTVSTVNIGNGLLINTNLYQFTPVSPVQVKAGDILVINSTGTSPMFYQQFNGPFNYEILSSNNNQLSLLPANDYPLLSFVIVKTTVTVTATTTSAQISQEQTISSTSTISITSAVTTTGNYPTVTSISNNPTVTSIGNIPTVTSIGNNPVTATGSIPTVTATGSIPTVTATGSIPTVTSISNDVIKTSTIKTPVFNITSTVSVISKPTSETSPFSIINVTSLIKATPSILSNASSSNVMIGIGISVLILSIIVLGSTVIIAIVLICFKRKKPIPKTEFNQTHVTTFSNKVYNAKEVIQVHQKPQEKQTRKLNNDKQVQFSAHVVQPFYDVLEMNDSIPVPVNNPSYELSDTETGAPLPAGVYCVLDDSNFFPEEPRYWEPSSDATGLYNQLNSKRYREIIRNHIQFTSHLGEGQFGTVHLGVWDSEVNGRINVAIKTLKDNSNEENGVKFLQEAAIMGQFHHPNVAKLYGVVTIGEPIMIVLELITGGDLREYLLRLQPIPFVRPGELMQSTVPSILLNFCRQIAAGMDYLSRKGFVHRDLAARNVLVTEQNICKISDFGMSRDVRDHDATYYMTKSNKIPVKWTAPEALHYRKYTSASDVWSYGIVLYEIWSLGHKPYESSTNQQCMTLVGSGYRLPPPPGCPKPIYKIMMQCWHPHSNGRPLFLQLIASLNLGDDELLKVTNSTVLGGPLQDGHSLYTDIQKTYHK